MLPCVIGNRHLYIVLFALLFPFALQAQAFQGLWIGSKSDSTARRTIRLRELHVRVTEACLPAGTDERECIYETDAISYFPQGRQADDSLASLIAQFSGPGWTQLLILRRLQGFSMEALVYTRFTGSA